MESLPIKMTKQTAVKLNLWKQGLFHASTAESSKEALAILRMLGCIQLDTINVVTRSHNLVFLARMKNYTEEWYWKLYERREVIEEYVHALSILPVEEFPYCAPSVKAFEARLKTLEKEKAHFLQHIYEQVKQLAPQPITSKNLNQEQNDVSFFETESQNPKDWKTTPVRWSLDCLWRSGKLMQVRNRHFGKVYHLIEEWLTGEEKDLQIPTKDIYVHFVQKALDAMGAATVADLADYYRIKRADANKALKELFNRGEVVPVELEANDEPHYMLRADLELIHSEKLQEEPTHGAFLSPFDNLIWTRERLLRLFDFDYRLECYIPEEQRKFGYYALPILLRGRIVGTIDLKLDRKSRSLLINRFILFDEGDNTSLLADLAPILQNLMDFLHAEHVKVEIPENPAAHALASAVRILKEGAAFFMVTQLTQHEIDK